MVKPLFQKYYLYHIYGIHYQSLNQFFLCPEFKVEEWRLGEESIKLVPFLCFHSLYAAFTSIKTALKCLPCPNYKNNNHLVGTSTTVMTSTRVAMGKNSIETSWNGIICHGMYVLKEWLKRVCYEFSIKWTAIFMDNLS